MASQEVQVMPPNTNRVNVPITVPGPVVSVSNRNPVHRRS